MFRSYRKGSAFARSFQLLRQAFLQSDGLPFNEILSESDIADVFPLQSGGRGWDR